MTEVSQTNAPKIGKKNSFLVKALTATYNGVMHSFATLISNIAVRELVNVRVTQKTKQVEIMALSLRAAIASFPVKFFSYYDCKYLGAALSAGLKYNLQDPFSALAQHAIKEVSYVYLQEKTDKIENPYLKIGAQVMTPAAIEFTVPLSFDLYRATANAVDSTSKLMKAKATIFDTLDKILIDLRGVKNLLPKSDIKEVSQKIKHTNDLLKDLFHRNENIQKLDAQIESIKESLLRPDFSKQNLFDAAAKLRSIIASIDNTKIVEQIQSSAQSLKKSVTYADKVMKAEIDSRVNNFIEIFEALKPKISDSLLPVDTFNEIVDYLVHYKDSFSDYATQWAAKTLSPVTGYMLQSGLDTVNDLSLKPFIEKLEGQEIHAELIKAVRLNDIKFVDLALKTHGKNVTDETYYLLARGAIANNNSDILTLALDLAKEQGRTIASPNTNHKTLINEAIVKNNYKMLEVLIKYGQNVNDADPLNNALIYNLFDMVKLLLENDAAINSYTLVQLLMLTHSPIAVSLDDINDTLKYAEKYIAENKETDDFIGQLGIHDSIDTLTKAAIELELSTLDQLYSYTGRYYMEFVEHATSPEEYIERYLPEDIGERFIGALSVKDISIFYNGYDHHS